MSRFLPVTLLYVIPVQDAPELQPTVPHCLDYSQFNFFYPSVFDSLGTFMFCSESPAFKALSNDDSKENPRKHFQLSANLGLSPISLIWCSKKYTCDVGIG